VILSSNVAADMVINKPDVYQSGGAMSEEEMKCAIKLSRS